MNLVPPYVAQLQQGGANPRPRVRVVRDDGSTAVLDGNAGLGVVVASEATEISIAKAKAHGAAVVLVRNSNHFGAAGIYALRCAEAGVIGLATTNSAPIMKVTGSRGRVLSNAPIAFGIPRPQAFPVVHDIAMSSVAGLRVAMAEERGEAIPEGWIVDEAGLPTTDPAAFRKGALVPIGDHKGYGLALFVEILTGVLSGAAIASDVGNNLEVPGVPPNIGHAFIAVDVERFLPAETFQLRVETLADQIRSAAKGPDVERILLPGEIEHDHEQRSLREGLLLPASVWQRLESVGAGLGKEADLVSIRRG